MAATYTGAVNGWTPTATADGSQLTASGYHCFSTQAAGDRARINEIFIGGQAAASTPNDMVLRRHTTHSTTPTTRTLVPTNNLTVYSATATNFITASTNPTVAAAATIQNVLNLTHNAFGGIVRWSMYQTGSEIWVFGNTANNDEVSLCNALLTGGKVGTHYIIEEM